MKHDYQAALDRIKRNIEPCDAYTEEDREHFMTIMDALELAASVVFDLSDVVRVVRCKDCEYWSKQDVLNVWGICSRANGSREGDYFCKDGNRREP